MRRALILSLILAAAACSAGQATPPGGPPPCRATEILGEGQPVPAGCRFRTLTGDDMTLGQLKGTPFLLNFWASWCPNCVEEMPALEQFHQRLGSRVAIVGADLLGVEGETESAARAFVRKTGASYTMIEDTGGLLFAHFSAAVFPPTTIWVDANGVVRHRQFGQIDLRTALDLTRRYLGVS